MKTKNKALLMALCAVLLVVASVFGTVAYLTSQASVTNTFTVGNISMDLDESDVDNDDDKSDNTPYIEDGKEIFRDKANTYELIPGHTITKDPIVHIGAASKDAWVFVTVKNEIAAYEAPASDDYTQIAEQIKNNKWAVLTDVTVDGNAVYYQKYTEGQDDKDLEVFEEFKVADKANDIEGWTEINKNNTTIIVTAYAVQRDGFDSTTMTDEQNALAAWNATFGASNS